MKNEFEKCSSQWRLMRYLLSNDWKIVSVKYSEIKRGRGETVVFVNADSTKALRINNGMWKDFSLYVDVARAFPDNPYFQNIEDDFFLDDGTYCVELEPLTEANAKTIKRKTAQKYTILKNLIGRPFIQSGPEAIDRILKKDPALKEAMTAIYAFHSTAYSQNKEFDPTLDLHGGNIMVRTQHRKNEMVLIDPFSYYTEGVSPNMQDASDILWRRKLGFFDFHDIEKVDWAIKSSRCGYGSIQPPS
ncbi:MAG: hypothetical protein COB76_02795 [Alphaproteobacteria bacterium]|nr:MAG: hypothetical protein COB76_02795 [Alphaproteobacteria bacterium]